MAWYYRRGWLITLFGKLECTRQAVPTYQNCDLAMYFLPLSVSYQEIHTNIALKQYFQPVYLCIYLVVLTQSYLPSYSVGDLSQACVVLSPCPTSIHLGLILSSLVFVKVKYADFLW